MFADDWNALSFQDRRRLRRLVRLGRLPDEPTEAELATAFAAHQRTRLWWRLFWLWFVPGLVLALGVAALVHPIVIGIVLASAGQALLTRHNATKIASRTASARAGAPATLGQPGARSW
jgi:hypothetical protein